MTNTVGATLVPARNQRHKLSNVGATLVVARNFSLFTFHFSLPCRVAPRGRPQLFTFHFSLPCRGDPRGRPQLFTFHFHVGATLVVARNKTM